MFMRAVHPGEVLKGELEELGITPRSSRGRLTCRPTGLARSSPASVRSPATPRYASVTGSATILSFGSTFRPSTTWFRPTGRPAPRSVISRRESAFREREPLRGSHDQRGSRDAAWRKPAGIADGTLTYAHRSASETPFGYPAVFSPPPHPPKSAWPTLGKCDFEDDQDPTSRTSPSCSITSANESVRRGELRRGSVSPVQVGCTLRCALPAWAATCSRDRRRRASGRSQLAPARVELPLERTRSATGGHVRPAQLLHPCFRRLRPRPFLLRPGVRPLIQPPPVSRLYNSLCRLPLSAPLRTRSP